MAFKKKHLLYIITFFWVSALVACEREGANAQAVSGKDTLVKVPERVVQKNDSITTITITFDGAANGTIATIPLLKYGKSKCITFDFDDGALVAPEKFAATTYTDGCGNAIPYTAGIAVNGRHGWNNAEYGVFTYMTYAKMREMINKGWDIMNHGYYHNFGEANDNYTFGPDAMRNLTALDSLILEKVRYKMNVLVVPTDYKGYHIAAGKYGYLGGSSQNAFDNLPLWMLGQRPHLVSQMKKDNYYVNEREFAWKGWVPRGQHGEWIWEFVDKISTASGVRTQEIGTHDMNEKEADILRQWLQEIKDRNKDDLMMTSLREFLEYQYLRLHIEPAIEISGNQMAINLNYPALANKNISWHDLSFTISGNAAIEKVECSDPDFKFTYNQSARLVNIKKRVLQW